MKILWVCNGTIPKIAKAIGCKPLVSGGWLTGISENLITRDDIELAICFPNKSITTKGSVEKINYCVLKYNNELSSFEEYIKDYKPDVIHIFGTEMPHISDIIEVCNKRNLLDKTVISIQGLVSFIANHYTAFLPEKVIRAYSFRDFLKNQNIAKEQRLYKKRGIAEVEALKSVKYVIGRTDWDKACTSIINKNLKYFKCNEILRKSFYENEWTAEDCEKYSIFVSQCNYPLKGFHIILEAMAEIVKSYPNSMLYTTGENPLNITFKQRLRQNYYKKYIGKLIKKYHLEKNVSFLGTLNEEQMCQRFVKSNVFVCCSSIENSPNSVGEAMLLGVPTISSDVGGVKSMLTHEKEGFIYQADAPYMLAHYVEKIFSDVNLQKQFSKNSVVKADLIYNKENNTQELIRIYKSIITNAKN